MSTTGGVSRERGYTVLIVLLLIAMGFAALDFFMLNQKNGEDSQAIALTTQIQVLSQQTAKFALESADGNADSFKELESTRNAIDSAVQKLGRGDPSGSMVHDDLLDATAMVAHLAQVIYGNKNAEEEEWEPVDLVAGF